MPDTETKDNDFASFPDLREARVRREKAEAAKAEAEAETERIEQDVKRAELEKLRQESAKLGVETRKAELETKHGELLVEAQSIEMDQMRRAAKEEEAKNYWHHRYVFNDAVTERTANNLIETLTRWSRTSPECDIEVVINSPGGSIMDGFAVVDFLRALREDGHKIRTHAIGMAASMGGVLLQAGTVRSMGANAMLLVHQGSLGTIGNFGEVKDTVKLMEILHERILDLFVERAKPINAKTTKQFIKRNWERKDWWISSHEAKTLGFVDEVL